MIQIFDGHNDALTREDYARFAQGRPGGHLDLPKMRAGGIRGAIFSIFTPSRGSRHSALPRQDGVLEFRYDQPVSHARAAAHATAAAGRLHDLELTGHLRLARGIADLDQAFADDGPPAAVLHLEGAEAIDPELEALELWYAAGLRSLGPVWSRANAFGHGVPFISPATPDHGPGLSEAGKALVRRCSELGILVDLSHLNEAGFWDAARLAPGPLVATHSAAHALCASSRNLTDAQLQAIGASGGVVGIVFACSFLRPDFADDVDTPLHLIATHAQYVADRVGVDHVALGSDFDGTTVPRGLDAGTMPGLLEVIARAGFDTGELEAIAWGNWRRVLAEWWGS
ncbi:MAG: dipeptidase [Solirubrobacterales bacterium]|nr:dipeptidase [Solirubrobacterales bacterium]